MGGSGSDDQLRRFWLPVLEQVVELAAHEVKDVLNGVSLNLEVIRSRSSDAALENGAVSPFATAAAAQMEILSKRTEALLFLTRAAREPADVAVAIRHLAELLVPAMKAEGGTLLVEGTTRPSPTSASAHASRFALAAGLLTLTKAGGSCRCRLERPEGSRETVVRFSHESAVALTPAPALAEAIRGCSIKVERSGSDLLLVFPGS